MTTTTRPCGHAAHPYRYLVCTFCGVVSATGVTKTQVNMVNDGLVRHEGCNGILAGATCYGGPVHEMAVRL